jgi:hypothetical protein
VERQEKKRKKQYHWMYTSIEGNALMLSSVIDSFSEAVHVVVRQGGAV